ncbi:MAG: hypothetical protein LBR08_12370 [Bacteroidales bacterium]|jgi:hypothetical protein|nr:hypothetical protein [Bacteroidales bacterium]
MNLLYFTVGDAVHHHYQCHFSILSFLSQGNIDRIYVYTDCPDFYKTLGTKVTLIEINRKMLQEWRGAYDFFWRIKIKLLEDVCRKYAPPSIIYLDTDTFLYRPSQTLSGGLSAGNAYMHENEGRLCDMKHTPRLMWKQINNKTFGGVRMREDLNMWNAGVVALPHEKQQDVLRLAVEICDDMCKANVTRRLIEQYALSVALQSVYALLPANGIIGHYWANKDGWNKVIVDFLLQAHMKGRLQEEMIEALAHFNFEGYPIAVPVSNTQRRLTRLLCRLFPDRKAQWLTCGQVF